MPAELRQQGYSEAQLRLVSEKVPCREAQAASLLAVFGEVSSFPIGRNITADGAA